MRKTAAPPPPPPSRPLSVSSFADDSDSMSVESLDGRVKLNVVLPDGTVVPLEVERRTAMMDLLVLVTKANNLNPGSHLLDVKNDNRDSVRYKPNAPIGSLDATTVHIVSKSSPHDSQPKIMTKPFEKTFRLRVHLPRNQLHVMRVSPQMPLIDIFNTICTERGLNPSKYELRHPIHTEMNLNPACCLVDYSLSEIALAATKDYNSSSSNHSDTDSVVSRPEEGKKKHGILNFMFKKNKSSTVEIIADDRHKSATLPSNNGPPHSTISPASSMPSISNINLATNKPSKKRQAPPPPPLRSKSTLSLQQKMPVAEDVDEEGVTYTSHSRHSSDSSGYHEASILSDSPETNGLDVEHSVYRDKLAHKTNIHHTESTSTLSMSVAGMKKRKAPPPPRLNILHTSQQSKSTSPLSPQLEMTPDLPPTNGQQHHEENGHEEEYLLGNNERLSSELPSNAEEKQLEPLPVPKPRHIKVTNVEESLKDAADNTSNEVVKECNKSNCKNNEHNEELLNSCENLSQSENTFQESKNEMLDDAIILRQETADIVHNETEITNNKLDCKSEVCESHAQLSETPQLLNGSEHSVNTRNSSMNSETGEIDLDIAVFSKKDKMETINRHSVSVRDINDTVEETGSVVSETLNEVPFEIRRRSSESSNKDQQTELIKEASVVTCDDAMNVDDKQDAKDDHLQNISNGTNDQVPNISNETDNQLPRSRHVSSSSTKFEREEFELAAAMNEFHNNSNTTKQHLASLWSQMISLPPNNHEIDNDDDDDDDDDDDHNTMAFDNDDTLSLNEEQFINNCDETITEAEPLEEPRHKDGGDPQVNGMFAEDVAVDFFKPDKDVFKEIEPTCEETPESALDIDITENDSIHDPIVTWEYKIPDVPDEFRDDNSVTLKQDESVSSEEAQDVTAVSSSSAATSDNKREEENSEDKVQLRHTVSRRPTVMFSISTYKNRIEEETSYQDKLVKTESFSSPSNLESSKTNVSPRLSTITTKSIKQDPIVKKSVPGQASSITNAITSNDTTSDTDDINGDGKTRSPLKKAKSELQLNVQTESIPESVPLTEHERLQEEYKKLHQQFIQWQKQLLNNQTMLQTQQILPDSTTDTLQPLQEFQEQFTSLPPMKTFQRQSTVPSETKTNPLSHSQSIDSTHSKDTHQSITERDIIYGPRPWRPVSISSWNQQTKFTAQNKVIDNSDEEVTKNSPEVKNPNEDTTPRQPYKERIASFNIGTFQKPTIKINRQTSHAAAFPRYPVVKGFANLPSPTPPPPPPPPKQMSKKPSVDAVKTSNFSNGNSDPVLRHSNNSPFPNWKSNSLPPHRQTNRQSGGKSITYFGDFESMNDSRHENVNNRQDVQKTLAKKHNSSVVNLNREQVASTDAVAHHDKNKFTTVINVGRANSNQQQTAAVKPALVPQKRNETYDRSLSREDTRDDLMSAIRDFGGRHGLKKVSSIETSWQERHGNVN